MIVLNFYNVKGGTGKSSLSYTIGLYLAEQGKKILFIDLDPQCSLSSIFLNERPRKTIYDFLSDEFNLENVIMKHNENIDFIPSSLKVFKIQEKVLQNKFNRALKKLNYDFVIMDNSPNFSSLSVSSLFATDILFVPSQVSSFDFDSLVFTIQSSMDVKEDMKINVILNRVPKNETKDEKEISSSEYLENANVLRFQNQNNIRKLIINKDPLNLSKYSKLNDAISEIVNRGIYSND